MRKIAPLILLLVASLALAGAAQASAASPAAAGPVALELPLDPELLGDDEEDIEEIEWEEDEEEEEEEDEWEEWEEGGEPPVECLLRSAAAKAVLNGQGKLRLTVRYTAFEATEARIVSRLRGGKGSLRLADRPAHLGERGVLHLTETLGDAEAERARAAHDFTVQVRISAAPRECRSLFARQLTAKQGGHGAVTWRQSDPIYGGGY